MKEPIIIIGANEFQEPLVVKANQLGYTTHVFAWEDGAVAKKSAYRFYPISIVEKEKILTEVRKISPVGVVSIASDLAMPTVNYLAQELGLTGNSSNSSVMSTNKYEMRQAFLRHGVPSARFTKISSLKEIDTVDGDYPKVVKPVDRSGSRGVTKIYRRDELEGAVITAMRESFSKQAIVEEFINGKEYSIESISYNGEHFFLAATEKFTTGEPHYIEIGHIQPANIEPTLLREIIRTIHRALDALDIKYGASHAEFKIDENGTFKIIEIGARMGGDYIGSDLVQSSTGIDFVREVIHISVGKRLVLPKHTAQTCYAGVRFIFSKEDLDLLENVRQTRYHALCRIGPIKDITAEEVVDSSGRFGYFVVRCDSYDDIAAIIGAKNRSYVAMKFEDSCKYIDLPGG